MPDTTFHNLLLWFPHAPALAAWLATCPRPQWQPTGSVFHNTYIPSESQWRGLDSLRSIERTYEAKAWDRGPHLFLASGTAQDGIFVMTPPWLPGIHAGLCNGHTFGVEVVADWNKRPPTAQQKQLLIDATAVLHRWIGIGPELAAHRDCMPARTCPGQHGYAIKAELQARLAAALRTHEPGPAPAHYTADSPLLAPAALTSDGYVDAWLARCDGRADAQYDRWSIEVIARSYWVACLQLGLDPWLVAAQCLHESGNLTSWWCARPRRNPAGIGVTGETHPRGWTTRASDWQYDETARLWRRGIAFAAWISESVPAHVGRLLAYALTDSQANRDQAQAIAVALGYRLLPASYRGRAPTLAGLNGRWATGAGYAAAVARLANALRST